MKKVRFIYNPYSGENLILSELDNIAALYQEYGYQIVPFRLGRKYTMKQALKGVDDSYHHILIAGGDGSVDSLVNAMKEENLNIPIGILPMGTANDFAKFLGIPCDAQLAVRQILESKPKGIDLGKINNKYFVNVASTGLFTDVSQKTDTNLKNAIGKMAYYIKGLEQLPNFRKLKVKITSDEVNYNGTMYLLLVFNGATAGNMTLANNADAEDGLLDVIMFKAVPIIELLPLLIKVFMGEHLDSSKVLHFKTKKLTVETKENIVTDIDGEKGPEFPLTIECVEKGIQILGLK